MLSLFLSLSSSLGEQAPLKFPVGVYPMLFFLLNFSTQTECLEKKFVVFADEIDLRAHTLQMHPSRPIQRKIQVSSLNGCICAIRRPPDRGVLFNVLDMILINCFVFGFGNPRGFLARYGDHPLGCKIQHIYIYIDLYTVFI